MSTRCKNSTTDVKLENSKHKYTITILIISILILLSTSILIILLVTHFKFTKKTVESGEKSQSKNVATEKSLQNKKGAKTLEATVTSETLVTADQSKAAAALNQFDSLALPFQTKSSIGTQTPVKFNPKLGKKLGKNVNVSFTPKSVTPRNQGSLDKRNQTPLTQEDGSKLEELGFSQVEKGKVIAALTKFTKNGFLDVRAFSKAMNNHTEHNVNAYTFFSETKFLELTKGTKSKEVISFCEYFKIEKSIIEDFLISYNLSEYLRKNLGKAATASEKDEGKNKILKAKRKLTFDD